ncbi:chorismate--pyruvate lyase family protein [Noviherbaspirillum sp. Root189]|uniref:chorismate--pyruvate lyase family protein n=1 Tax=Noviherbaspirillum sp. Root189 TaxID=1736487 RepID=UPI00070C545C|nr:chorismate lyase [Noviherbaspirillum sp. Root189]KRB90509.1 chorismate--pyruvate lyase [Noviherbaspirillum sp. Root189]
MTPLKVKHARWCTHVNGVFPSPVMRDWLSDNGSLTRKLTLHSRQFRVERLRQEQSRCLSDEFRMIGLPRQARVQEREVLLRCDELPVVFGHTIVPTGATAADWPFFGTLGNRSLGTTLFGDPRVVQGTLQYARLHLQHPLARRAGMAIGKEFTAPLFARRCLYQRKKGVLLVTELFLPALSDLTSHSRPGARLNESTR